MARAALVVMFLLALAGCTVSLADLNELSDDLNAAGYEVVGLHHNSMNGHSVLSVEAVMPNEIPAEEDADRIAEVVWEQFSGDFDELHVTINAQPMLIASNAELAARFGERPGNLSDDSDESDRSESSGSTSDGRTVTFIVVGIAALVFVGLLVLLNRRGRRRPPPPVAPPMYQYPYQPPYQMPPQPPQHQPPPHQWQPPQPPS